MEIEIKKIPIDQIHFAPYNPRIIEDSEFEKLKQSILTFGCVSLIVLNQKTGNAVGGNQTLKALLELGYKEASVAVVNLSLPKEKALNIALNKISGRFDFEKLTILLEELSKMPDIDFELTGFEPPELSQLLDRYGEQRNADDFDFDSAVQTIKNPITRRGDRLIIGKHVLVCGDSANPDDLKLLMGDEKAAMLFTDPPYGISYYQGNRPNMSFRPKKCRKWETIYQDDLSEEEYQKWLEKVFINMDNFLAPGAPIYVFNAHKQFFGMYGILRKLKYHIGTVIVWAKPNFSISYGDYNPQVEFCAYAWKEDNGAHKWYGPTNETTLWEVNRDDTRNYQHLTQKPVELPARAIRNSSQRGDAILELFGGSGSALIAAESLDRRCFCMEINPIFCDGIIKRFVNYVGVDKVSEDIRKKYLQEA